MTPAPPYRPGDRVRCLVSTATRRMWPAPVELRGRRGIVVGAEWREPRGREPGHWRVAVDLELGQPYCY